jgi:hypothetical protein
MSDARVTYEPSAAARLKLGGAAVVCCVHGVEKARVTDLVYDMASEQAKECPCCRNVYPTDLGDPVIPCHECRPRSAA